MTTVTFLGTGNFFAPGRYWNSFVVDEHLLVETAPTTLPNLRKAGMRVGQLDCIAISHFHPDHTFGWPFLLLELVREGRDRPLYVAGPPGLASFLEEMMRFGSVMDVHEEAHESLDIRYIEVDGTWQNAGPVRFRAVEVEHVPELTCYGYLFGRGGQVLGYSGDTHPCAGLEELARCSDALILECANVHASKSHMDVESVKSLQDRFPAARLVLTHLGLGVDRAGLGGLTIPSDFSVVEL